ncbi:MAG: hypothetical protein ACE5GM_00060 [bacterium]
MKNKSIVVLAVLAVSLLLLSAACSKKEESAQRKDPLKDGTVAPSINTSKMPANHQAMMQTGKMPADHQAIAGGKAVKKARRLVVSDEVKATWKTIKLLVKNKKTGNSKTYEVPVNSEFKVPDTKLVVKIGAFLPDFTMPPGVLTSASNQPNNPALFAKILEGKAEKYSGWLFAKFPDMHAFEHDLYAITLKNDFAGKTAAKPAAAESHEKSEKKHGAHAK